MYFPFTDYHQKGKDLWKIGGLLYFLDTTNHGLRHAWLKAKTLAYPRRDQNHKVIQIEGQCPERGSNDSCVLLFSLVCLFVLICFFKILFCFSSFFPQELDISPPSGAHNYGSSLGWHMASLRDSRVTTASR